MPALPFPALTVRSRPLTMSQPTTEARSPDLERRLSWPAAGLVRVSGSALHIVMIGVALLAYVFAILTGPILREWDTYLSFSHLYVWTAELRTGHVLSTWTPIDANGFGSPLPFFYHKLFNLAGAALTLVSGDIVIGYRLTILLFSATLFTGIYLCARRLAADRLSSALIATVSVLAPYYLLKINIGTIAEYSAAALVPLVVALMLDAREGRFGMKKAVALLTVVLLLALAHVLVAVMVFGVLIPVVVYLSAVSRRAYLALAATTLAFVLFVGFFYVPFSYWSARFSPAQAFIGGGVENHLFGLRDVFSPSPLSTLGWPFFALLAGVALYAFRARRSTDPRMRAAFVLGCISLAIVLMMTKIARPFWLLGGPLEYFQFPYRLLAVGTPLGLIALAGLQALLPSGARRYAQLALLLFALVNAGRLATIAVHAKSAYSPATPTISHAELNREVPAQQVIGPDAGGEYLPARYRSTLAGIDVFKTPVTSILPAPRPFIEAEGCRFPAMPHPLALHRLTLPVTCATGGILRINQFSTSMLVSEATNGTATIPPDADNPVIEFTLPAGQWTVTVRQRGWLELTAMAWRARLSTLTR